MSWIEVPNDVWDAHFKRQYERLVERGWGHHAATEETKRIMSDWIPRLHALQVECQKDYDEERQDGWVR